MLYLVIDMLPVFHSSVLPLSLYLQVNNPLSSTTLPTSTQVDDYYTNIMEEILKANSAELLMKTVGSITSVLTDFVSVTETRNLTKCLLYY